MATIDSADFQRAFMALSYLLGRREAELLAPLGDSPPHEEARALVRGLAHPDRPRRAELLARELSRVALGLEARLVK